MHRGRIASAACLVNLEIQRDVFIFASGAAASRLRMALYITGMSKFDLHLCRRQPVTDWAREVARVSVLPNEAAEGGCCPGGPSAVRARRQPRAGRLVERDSRHGVPGAGTCAYSA